MWACRHRLPRERGFLPGLFDFNLMSELKQSLLFCLAGSLIYVGMPTQPAWRKPQTTKKIAGCRIADCRLWKAQRSSKVSMQQGNVPNDVSLKLTAYILLAHICVRLGRADFGTNP